MVISIKSVEGVGVVVKGRGLTLYQTLTIDTLYFYSITSRFGLYRDHIVSFKLGIILNNKGTIRILSCTIYATFRISRRHHELTWGCPTQVRNYIWVLDDTLWLLGCHTHLNVIKECTCTCGHLKQHCSWLLHAIKSKTIHVLWYMQQRQKE